MAHAILAYANAFKSGAITAGSSEPALGPTNLSLDQCSPSTGFQTRYGIITAAAGATLRCTAAAPGSVWRAFCLAQTNLTPSASITIQVWQSTGVVSTSVIGGPSPGYGQIVRVLPIAVTGDYVTFTFDDIQNADGFISIGGAYAGPAWEPSAGITWDTTYGSLVMQRRPITSGGQDYRSLQYRQRFWKIRMDFVSDTDAWEQLGELDRISALGGNVLFIPDYTSVNVYREAVFGTVDNTSDVSFAARLYNARSWGTQITERL